MRIVALAAATLFAMSGMANADVAMKVDPVTGMLVMPFDCAVEMQPGVLYERAEIGPIYPQYPGYPAVKPAWMETGKETADGVPVPKADVAGLADYRA